MGQAEGEVRADGPTDGGDQEGEQGQGWDAPLEAASRGLPMVVSRSPSLGEIFGEAAILVSPRDESSVAKALHRVLTEPALRSTLTAAGRRLARRYSWDQTAALTHAALRRAARP